MASRGKEAALREEIRKSSETNGYDIEKMDVNLPMALLKKFDVHISTLFLSDLLDYYRLYSKGNYSASMIVKVSCAYTEEQEYMRLLSSVIRPVGQDTDYVYRQVFSSLCTVLQSDNTILYNYFVRVGFGNWFNHFSCGEFVDLCSNFLVSCTYEDARSSELFKCLIVNLTGRLLRFRKYLREAFLEQVLQVYDEDKEEKVISFVKGCVIKAARFMPYEVRRVWLKIANNLFAGECMLCTVIDLLETWQYCSELPGHPGWATILRVIKAYKGSGKCDQFWSPANLRSESDDPMHTPMCDVLEDVCYPAEIKITDLIYKKGIPMMYTDLDYVILKRVCFDMVSRKSDILGDFIRSGLRDFICPSFSDEPKFVRKFLFNSFPMSPPAYTRCTGPPVNREFERSWLKIKHASEVNSEDCLSLVLLETDADLRVYCLERIKASLIDVGSYRSSMRSRMCPWPILEEESGEGSVMVIESSTTFGRRFPFGNYFNDVKIKTWFIDELKTLGFEFAKGASSYTTYASVFEQVESTISKGMSSSVGLSVAMLKHILYGRTIEYIKSCGKGQSTRYSFCRADFTALDKALITTLESTYRVLEGSCVFIVHIAPWFGDMEDWQMCVLSSWLGKLIDSMHVCLFESISDDSPNDEESYRSDDVRMWLIEKLLQGDTGDHFANILNNAQEWRRKCFLHDEQTSAIHDLLRWHEGLTYMRE